MIAQWINGVDPRLHKAMFWAVLLSLHVLYKVYKKKELTNKWSDELLLVLWSLILIGYALGVIDLIWMAQKKGSFLFG